MKDEIIEIEKKEFDLIKWTNDKNIKHFVFSWNRKIFYFGLSILILFVSTCAISVITFNYGEYLLSPAPEAMSLQNQLKYYRKSFNDYSQANGEQLLWTWIKLFKDCRYKQNGDYKYKQVDCTGAVNRFFQEYKSNFALENVESLGNKIKKLSALGLITKCDNYNLIKPGNLILMKFGKSRHVGIVYKKSKSTIQYMDLNVKTNGWGLREIWWKSDKIIVIAKMSYPLWIGNLLK